MQPRDDLVDLWTPTMPPPVIRLLRPEDLAPVEPLVDLMSFSAAIFATVGVGLLIVAFARRRRSDLDLALSRMARVLGLSRREVHVLRRIAPLVGDGGVHPAALLVSRHGLRTATQRARFAVGAGVLRMEEEVLRAIERSVEIRPQFQSQRTD